MWGWLALVTGLVGMWLAGRHALGWVIGAISAALWFPPMIVVHSWSAVTSSALSVVIAGRNYMIGRRL